jgi:hypothetical protein
MRLLNITSKAMAFSLFFQSHGIGAANCQPLGGLYFSSNIEIETCSHLQL